MKSVLLARHSYAESSFSKSDFEREITKEGFKRIEEQVALIKQLNLKIDLIICSSATRTIQTAQHYKSLLNIEAEILDYQWLYEEYLTHELLDLIQKQDNDFDSVMIIGHNPNISVMATNFNHSRNYQFAPGAIVKLDFDIDDWSKLEIRKGKENIYLK